MKNILMRASPVRKPGLLMAVLFTLLLAGPHLKAQTVLSGCVGSCGGTIWCGNFTRLDPGTANYQLTGFANMCPNQSVVVTISGPTFQTVSMGSSGSLSQSITLRQGESISLCMQSGLNGQSAGSCSGPGQASLSLNFLNMVGGGPFDPGQRDPLEIPDP